MTQIFFCYISQKNHSLLMQKYSSEFSNTFIKKLENYHRWQDAQLSLLGRLLLKYGFEKSDKPFVEKDLVFSEYNKPMLKNHPFQFNISHSGEIVICIISDIAEVGIDIELIHKNVNVEGFKPQMTNKEWKQLNIADSKNQAFFEYWTKKEAVLKANGKGLLIPLNSFEIISDKSEINNDCFYLKEIYVEDDYICHIAFKNKTDQRNILPQKVIIEGNGFLVHN